MFPVPSVNKSWNKSLYDYTEPKIFRGKRTIPIFSKTVLAWLEDNKKEKGLIFATKNGNPIAYNCVWNTFKKALKMAGLSDKKIHSFRHTAVSNWFDKGGTIAEVSEMAGHADIQTTTRIYQHIINDNTRKRLKKFGTD